MGPSWQQGPLGRDPNGTLLAASPMPERLLDDRVVADTQAPLVLYESGFAPRWYVPRADIAAEALHAVEGQTFCPYKGLASHYGIGEARNLSVDEFGGVQLADDVAATEA
jgi:uncharacterized protein (DUF427 family)